MKTSKYKSILNIYKNINLISFNNNNNILFNYDILTIINKYLFFDEIIQLSFTCHILYQTINNNVSFSIFNISYISTYIFNNMIKLNSFLDYFMKRFGHEIQYLDISNRPEIKNPLDHSTLVSIAKNIVNNLNYLNVSYQKHINDDFFKMISKKLTKLEKLVIIQCPSITDETLNDLKNVVHLNELNISYAKLITSNGMIQMLKQMNILNYKNNLHSIILKNCNKIDYKAIKEIAILCPNLKKLDIGRTKGINDLGLEMLANYCPKLEYLDISLCNPFSKISNIKDSTMLYFLNKCKYIKYLSLQGHSSLSKIVLETLQNKCNYLTQLNLGRCNGMIKNNKNNDIKNVFIKFHNLQKLHLWTCTCIRIKEKNDIMITNL